MTEKIEEKMLEEIASTLRHYIIRNLDETIILEEGCIVKQFLPIISRYCVIPEEGEWPSMWDGKGDMKSALTYKKELKDYRKVREIEI